MLQERADRFTGTASENGQKKNDRRFMTALGFTGETSLNPRLDNRLVEGEINFSKVEQN